MSERMPLQRRCQEHGKDFEGGVVMNTGDTAFVMISTALVFFMTPGLAFFMAG